MKLLALCLTFVSSSICFANFKTNNAKCVSVIFQSGLKDAGPYKWLGDETSLTKASGNGREETVVNVTTTGTYGITPIYKIDPVTNKRVYVDTECNPDRTQTFEDLTAQWVEKAGKEFAADKGQLRKINAICSQAESQKIKDAASTYVAPALSGTVK